MRYYFNKKYAKVAATASLPEALFNKILLPQTLQLKRRLSEMQNLKRFNYHMSLFCTLSKDFIMQRIFAIIEIVLQRTGAQ